MWEAGDGALSSSCTPPSSDAGEWMPGVVKMDRAAWWEAELPSLERLRQRSPFGCDCWGRLHILGRGSLGEQDWSRGP